MKIEILVSCYSHSCHQKNHLSGIRRVDHDNIFFTKTTAFDLI